MRFAAPFLWDSNDTEPVDLAFMLIIPDGERSREHLKLLARLSRRIVHEEFRDALRAAPDEETVVRWSPRPWPVEGFAQRMPDGVSTNSVRPSRR